MGTIVRADRWPEVVVPKILSLQYARGLAAILVVAAHSLMHPLSAVDYSFARIGSLGVALFFVISGFIMVVITGEGRFDALSFYRKRILRVVPLYWLATLAVAAASIAAPSLFKNTAFDLEQLVESLLFVPHYRSNGEIVPVLKLGWTLNLEMFFYACFGCLAFLRAPARVAILSAAFMSLSALGAAFEFRNAALASYTMFDMTTFCIGMGLGLLYLLRHDLFRAGRSSLALLAVGLCLLGASFAIDRASMFTHTVIAAQALGSALALAAGLSWEARIPRLRPLETLGDASYAVYLVHMYFIGAVLAAAKVLAPGLPWADLVAAGFACGTLGGVATYFAVERPVMRAVRGLARGRARRRAGDAALPIGGRSLVGLPK